MGTNGQFGSIRKLPSGRYQVRYFHLGRRIAADTTFPTKSDARAFLSGVETDLMRGNYVDPSAGRITFAEYADWWIEQRPLRPRTRETYDSQLKHLLSASAVGEIMSYGIDVATRSTSPEAECEPERPGPRLSVGCEALLGRAMRTDHCGAVGRSRPRQDGVTVGRTRLVISSVSGNC
jgi:hypothetical protein